MFPLIDLGMDRAAAQKYVLDAGQVLPVPSCCVRCPYQSHEEIAWTARHYPKQWAEWIEIEANGLANEKHRRFDAAGNVLPRHGVKGLKNIGSRRAPKYVTKTLEDFHTESLAKIAHIPADQIDAYLEAYTFSHGHNVRSKH
jgi:hypothetical protein